MANMTFWAWLLFFHPYSWFHFTSAKVPQTESLGVLQTAKASPAPAGKEALRCRLMEWIGITNSWNQQCEPGWEQRGDEPPIGAHLGQHEWAPTTAVMRVTVTLRSGWMGLWATCEKFHGREVGIKWFLKIPSNSNCSMILSNSPLMSTFCHKSSSF